MSALPVRFDRSEPDSRSSSCRRLPGLNRLSPGLSWCAVRAVSFFFLSHHMATATVRNQDRIIANQKRILSNQDQLDTVIANEEKIIRNQEAIIRNQKKIMATLSRVLRRLP